MNNNENKKPRGRPLLYPTLDQKKAAIKEYRKTWYNKNKEKLKQDYNETKEERKIKRKENIWKGYYIIYDKNYNAYLGFSKDAKNRCRDILKNISTDKTGSLYDKFDKTRIWSFKMVQFLNEADFDVEDTIKKEMTEFNFFY